MSRARWVGWLAVAVGAGVGCRQIFGLSPATLDKDLCTDPATGDVVACGPDGGGGAGGGSVGSPCATPSDCQGAECATPLCTAGKCGLLEEVDGTVCSGTGTCKSGVCKCPGNQTACGGSCVDTTSNAMNCGACGKVCLATQICSGSACGCATGQIECGGSCVDTTSDPMNCKTCGTVCEPPLTCSGSVCVCSGSVCGSTCIDTTTDPKNCGFCGRDCLGAACQGGLCQAQVLASGQPNPTHIFVNATDVYWDNPGTSGSVMMVASGGGMPVTVAAGQPSSAYLALDDTGVYWTTTTLTFGGSPPGWYTTFSVMKAVLGGGSPGSFVTVGPISGKNGARALAADGINVYWDNAATYTVDMVPKGGGTPTTAASQVCATGVSFLTAAGGNVFWSCPPYGVFQCPIGGSCIKLAGGAGGLAIAGADLYRAGGTSVDKIPIGGGTVVMLATTQNAALDATDGSYVYYADGSTIEKVATSGGTPIALATGNARGIAVDSTYVYWTDTAGTVNRVAK